MTAGSTFEDFLCVLKARDKKTIQNRALIFMLLNNKVGRDEMSDVRKHLARKSLEENIDAAIHHLAGHREVKYVPIDLDDGNLYYELVDKDGCEYELYVAPDDLIHYELKISTAWTEKPKQEYAGLELSEKVNTIEFFEDLKILREKGVCFEDVGKILNRKYPSITLYRPKIRTHYLEGVLSASPSVLPSNDNEIKELADYCVSLEVSQTKNNDKPNYVFAVLTINTKWNFVKK